jgi:hypothetical protein
MRCAGDGGYVAVVEVCGFNDWLLRLLPEHGCEEVILIQPEEHHRKKPIAATPIVSASCCGSIGSDC